jgi:SAM-dependent methyltransferase
MHPEEFREMQALEESHFWFAGKRLLLRVLLERAGGARGRVLDVGCGTGGILLSLARDGAVVGIDREALALRFCRDKGLRAVVRGSASALPFADGSFDACVSFDVLEHVDDEQLLLGELRRVLRPGGRALISVPAFRALWSQHDETLEHRRRYRRSELLAQVRQAGFRVDWSSYTNFFVFPPALLWRVLRRWTGIAPALRTDFVVPPAPINRALVGLYACEAELLRRVRLPFGVSVACVASRE